VKPTGAMSFDIVESTSVESLTVLFFILIVLSEVWLMRGDSSHLQKPRQLLFSALGIAADMKESKQQSQAGQRS